MRKATLLRSVSAIATAAASTGGAHQALAQDTGSEGYYYNVQGGLLFSPAEEYLTQLEDKLRYDGGFTSGSSYFSSYSSGFDDLMGFNGSVSFGKQLDPTWDVRGTASVNHLGSTSGFFSGYNYYSGYSIFSGSGFEVGQGFDALGQEGTYSFGFETLDLEIGYTPVLSDNFTVRLFAGIRALHFKDTFEGWVSGFGAEMYYYSGGDGLYSGSSGFNVFGFEGTVTSEFYGIGPRVGIEGSKRFEGTNFGISGSVSGAVLFGTQKTTTEGYGGYYTSGSSYSGSAASGSSHSWSEGDSGMYSSSYEVDKNVLDLQAKLGLDYYLDDANKLTIGVQGEKLFNVGHEDDYDVTRTTGGVFVGLSGQF